MSDIVDALNSAQNNFANEVVDEPNPWKFVSFGIVSVSNLAGEDIIQVWPAELLPFEEGSVPDILEDESITLVDIDGKPRHVRCERKATVSAKWYCTQDGRQTPPNVADGETVELYQYGHKDTYYWVSNGRQPALRRLEHVTYGFSNLSSGRNPFDALSSYGYTFSTREKFVKFWTSKSDGEKYAYEMLFDAADNKARLRDDDGNVFGINSDEREVFLQNKDNTYLRAYQTYMFGYARHLICFRSRIIRLNAPSVIIGGGGGQCDREGNDESWRQYTHVYANQDRTLASIGNRNPGMGSARMSTFGRAMVTAMVASGRWEGPEPIEGADQPPTNGLPAGKYNYSEYDGEKQHHRSTGSILTEAPVVQDHSQEYTRTTGNEITGANTSNREVKEESYEKVGKKSTYEVPEVYYNTDDFRVKGSGHFNHLYASVFYHNGNDLGAMVTTQKSELDQLKQLVQDLTQRVIELESKA